MPSRKAALVPPKAEETRYDQIVALLAAEGPMSTYKITLALGFNGTGQALVRLRYLEVRGRVERIDGDRPGWHKWRLTGA